MKYISLTLQYLFKLDNGKRFLALFLFALPPGLVLSYYFPITGYLDWFVNYSGNYASYSDLWLSLVERDTLKIGLLILGYILVIFSVSAITTLTVRSARIGKFQVKSVFYLINENFFPSFSLMTVFLISLIVFQSLLCLFFFLWQIIPGITVGYVLAIFTAVIGLLIFIYTLAGASLWLPIMSINGLKPFKALAVSYYKTRKEKNKLFTAYLIAFAVIIALGFVAYLFAKVWYVKWLINALNYTMAALFFTVMSILTLFEIDGITREDLVKRPYLRR
ncbi:MAG: hypothetical protein ACOYEC_01850 [Christensenellales bacterium]|jgi:hypothetical protein|nr:hypothetical protein [Clostridiales bacterium]